jgi:hypothetical protein
MQAIVSSLRQPVGRAIAVNATARFDAHAKLYARLTAAGFGLFLSAELAYFLFSPAPSFYMPSVDGFGGTAIGRDFLNVWLGGRSALGAGPAAWFDFRIYNSFLDEFVPGLKEAYFWSYPPHVLLFIWPFGLLPYLVAFALWTVAGLALLLGVAAHCSVERRHLLFIAVAPAVAVNTIIGQNGCFTAALLMAGLANLERRPILSGVCFGILTIKPQLGLLLPLMLVMTGRWRTIASAAVTAASLVAATALTWGPEIWTEYFAKVVPQQRYLQEHGTGMLFLQIPSAFYAMRHLGLSVGPAWTSQTLVSGLTLAAVAWTYWRKRDPVLSMSLLVVAIFLVSPYTLNYDMVVLGWVLALLRQQGGNAPADHYLMAALWTLPITMMLLQALCVPLGLLVLAAFAARLVWRMAHADARQPADGTAPLLGART